MSYSDYRRKCINYYPKGRKNIMANYNTETLADLATEAMVQGIVATPVETPKAEKDTPCAENDKACTKRWLDSLSDCC